MTTRSTKLFATSVVGRPSGTVYTVPAGFVVILKSLLLYEGTGTEQAIDVVLYQRSPQVFAVVQSFLLPGFKGAGWDGWVVLNADDEVRINYVQGPVYVWGSGAELPVPF